MHTPDEQLDHALQEEFAGHKDAIHALKISNAHFKKLLVTNHALWTQIQNIQNDVTPADDVTLENLEKERLLVLDEISSMLSANAQ
jgi:uncharacterized protein